MRSPQQMSEFIQKERLRQQAAADKDHVLPRRFRELVSRQYSEFTQLTELEIDKILLEPPHGHSEDGRHLIHKSHDLWVWYDENAAADADNVEVIMGLKGCRGVQIRYTYRAK